MFKILLHKRKRPDISHENIEQHYKNKDHEYERDRKLKRNESEHNQRQYIHNTQVHTTKYIEHVPNKLTTTSMRDRLVYSR